MSTCENVKIQYVGDGSTKLFSFPFTYIQSKDVNAYIWDFTTKEWVNQKNKFVFANPTTVEFLTPPPAPDEPGVSNVMIGRVTDVEVMQAIFYPGSSIRAEDLNENFDQLRSAIEEGRCALTEGLTNLDEQTWNTDEAYTYDDQINRRWVEANDTKIATSDAIRARHDSYVQSNKPPELPYEQTGKQWQNTDDCWSSYWQNSVDDQGNDSKTWVAYVNTGPRGEQGPQGPPGQSIVGPPGPEGPEGPNGGTFPDAPADGTLYGRKDNAWEHVGSSDFSGDYNDLTNKPTIGDGEITITQEGVEIGKFTVNQTGPTTIDVNAPAPYTATAPIKIVNNNISIDLLSIPNAP